MLIGLAARRDVERPALERHQALVDELRAAVDEDRLLGADLPRAGRYPSHVGLVGLAEVGGQGIGNRALLTDPGDRDGGVEAAGERDADTLADGQRSEDPGHGASVSGRTAPIDRRSANGADGALQLVDRERALELRPDDTGPVDDEREGLGREPPLLDPAVDPLRGVVVLVDLDVDEVDAARRRLRFRTAETTSTVGPHVRVWQYCGVANETTNGRSRHRLRDRRPVSARSGWRDVVSSDMSPPVDASVGVFEGIARSPTDGAALLLATTTFRAPGSSSRRPARPCSSTCPASAS